MLRPLDPGLHAVDEGLERPALGSGDGDQRTADPARVKGRLERIRVQSGFAHCVAQVPGARLGRTKHAIENLHLLAFYDRRGGGRRRRGEVRL
jgi:hypothetical protein